MKCQTADKLSQYVDELISGQEHMDIKNHLVSCEHCLKVVQTFQEEQQFLKDTLQTPSLPVNFADLVLDQVEPYPGKIVPLKKPRWKRLLPAAAGVVLAVGLTTTLNPSFAEWVGGLFSTEQVDDGLRLASDAGFTKRVNLEVKDQDMSFKVEDVVADSSRVALSYQIIDKEEKLVDEQLSPVDSGNEVYVTDKDGNRLESVTTGWSKQEDYGLVEISLRHYVGIEDIIVKFNLVELDGQKGDWRLEVPVDLRESLKSTTTVQLEEKKTTSNGVDISMKEFRYAPSSNELLYKTAFAKDEQEKIDASVKKLEQKFGQENMTFAKYETAIQYHLKDNKNNVVFHNNYLGELHTSGLAFLHGSGQPTGILGQMAWNDSFVPQKDMNKFTFVLDGVYKTVPSELSIKINPKELPMSFEYKGNFITIKSAKIKNDYSLRKSLWPVQKETTFNIEMKGGREESAAFLGDWVLVDEKGKAHVTYKSESLLNEKDENGRKKLKATLKTYDVNEVPKELTLYLLSETLYEEAVDRWEVDLYK